MNIHKSFQREKFCNSWKHHNQIQQCSNNANYNHCEQPTLNFICGSCIKTCCTHLHKFYIYITKLFWHNQYLITISLLVIKICYTNFLFKHILYHYGKRTVDFEDNFCLVWSTIVLSISKTPSLVWHDAKIWFHHTFEDTTFLHYMY